MNDNEINIDLNKATKAFLLLVKEQTEASDDNIELFKEMFQTACTEAIIENSDNEDNSEENKESKKTGKKLSGYNIYMKNALSKKEKGGQQLQMKDAINKWNEMSEKELNKWKALATEHNKNIINNNNNKKKKLSGYNLFMQKKMKKIENGGEGINMSNAIKMWQALNDEQKNEWKEKAKLL